MTNHILGNIDSDKFLPIMNSEGLTYEVREDGRAARPSFDHGVPTISFRLIDLFKEVIIYEWTFTK
jgi:hypothetical protein